MMIRYFPHGTLSIEPTPVVPGALRTVPVYELTADESASLNCVADGPANPHVICGYDVREIPELTPEQFEACCAERRRLGRALGHDEVLAIVRAHGGGDDDD